MKTAKTIIIGIFLAGMAAGYIAGLWQQAAQRQHQQNCTACQQHDETIRNCNR